MKQITYPQLLPQESLRITQYFGDEQKRMGNPELMYCQIENYWSSPSNGKIDHNLWCIWI